MIVTNTYGHTNESPRFRVIILTSAPVGPAAYEALWDAVANKLRDAGYHQVAEIEVYAEEVRS